MMIISYFLLFLLSVFLVKYFQKYALKKNLLDHPNMRSSHRIVKPRGGGLVFVCLSMVFAICLVIFGSLSFQQFMILCPPAFCIGVLGYLDDQFQLAARIRFIVQFIISITTVILLGCLSHLGFTLNLFTYLLAVLVLLWSTNLFNFMDGIDGIASIEAIFVLGFGGLFLWLAGGHGLAMLSWAIVAAVAGFLYWNWPPSKIFMGDVGSTFLGFVIAGLALMGKVYYHIPILLWFILYAVFCLDTSLTLAIRFLKREKWYVPHCSHAYQRLYQMGWSHQRIVCALSGINIILAVLAIIGFSNPKWIGGIAAMIGIGLVFLYWRIISFKIASTESCVK